MFHATWTSPYKGEIKTLRLKGDPIRKGIGHYEDVDGKKWDVFAIFGGKKPYVNARPVDNLQRYSTSSFGGQSYGSTEAGNSLLTTWEPYYIEDVSQ